MTTAWSSLGSLLLFAGLGLASGCATSAHQQASRRSALETPFLAPPSVENRRFSTSAPSIPSFATQPLLAEVHLDGPQPAEASSPTPTQPAAERQAPQADPPTPPRTVLVHEARLDIAIHEVPQRIEEVIQIARDSDGVLQSQDDRTVVIRVPASRFRQVLDRLEAIGDVLHRQVSARDMTDQRRDLRVRLQTALETRQRLEGLLSRAPSVSDALAVERDLDRITGIIEGLRGQLRSLEEQVAFATIAVRFQPVQTPQQIPREQFHLPFTWLSELGLVHLLRLRP